MICLAEPKPRLLAHTKENLKNDVPPWHKAAQVDNLSTCGKFPIWELSKERVWTVGVRPAGAGSRTVLYHNKQGTCKASSKAAEGPMPSASLWGVPQSPR